jgi:RimJ/RimL family protein N-acetyltransferase
MTLIAETPRLLLRHFDVADADALRHVFGDPAVMHFGPGVQTPQWLDEWLRTWIDRRYAAWGFGMWAVVEKSSGAVIGYCGLTQFNNPCAPDDVELGYRLARAHWGQGYATEAATATRDHAFAALALPRIIAMIDPRNTASLRVAAKLGMRYERDVLLEGYTHPDGVYAIERGEWERLRS